jgi:hypothetical protein
MKTVTTTLLVLSFLVLTAGTNLKAQSSNYKKVTANSIETLKAGISSENKGLKRSSIYMAGLYKIDEAVDVLIDRLSKEQDPNTIVLIALSLYNIGNPEGMEAVKHLSLEVQDARVKKMSTLLYRKYVEINGISKR